MAIQLQINFFEFKKKESLLNYVKLDKNAKYLKCKKRKSFKYF